MSKISELDPILSAQITGREIAAFVHGEDSMHLSINNIMEQAKRILYYQGDGDSSQPARLICGSGYETLLSTWQVMDTGTFTIDIDGDTLSLTGLDFSGVTGTGDDMYNKIAVIMTNALTASMERDTPCIWTGNRFIIQSGITTSTSAITVATGTVAIYLDAVAPNASISEQVTGSGDMKPIQEIWADIIGVVNANKVSSDAISSTVTANKVISDAISSTVTANKRFTDEQRRATVSVSTDAVVGAGVGLVIIDATSNVEITPPNASTPRTTDYIVNATGGILRFAGGVLPSKYSSLDTSITGVLSMTLISDGTSWVVNSYIDSQ